MVKNGRSRTILLAFGVAIVGCVPGIARAQGSCAEPAGAPRLCVSPESAVAGTDEVLTFSFEAPEGGFVQGAKFQLEFPVQPNGGQLSTYLMTDMTVLPPTPNDICVFPPSVPGKVWAFVSTDANGADCVPTGVDVKLYKEGVVRPRLVTISLLGAVNEGNYVVLKYHSQMRKNAGKVNWKYRTDLNANNSFEPCPSTNCFDFAASALAYEGPEFTFAPATASYIQLVAPADIKEGDSFNLALVALDKYGNEASHGSGGVVTLSATSEIADLPATFDFGSITSSDHPSVHVIEGLEYGDTGFQKITVSESSLGLPVYTNYSYVHPSNTPNGFFRRFFGDTHFHTGEVNGHGINNPASDHLNGYTAARDAYDFIYNVARLDFASLSEHDGAARENLDDWGTVKSLTEQYDNDLIYPGFTTFRAYEYTTSWMAAGATAHQIVLYKGNKGEIIAHGNPPPPPPPEQEVVLAPGMVELVAALEHQRDVEGANAEFMIIPHPMGTDAATISYDDNPDLEGGDEPANPRSHPHPAFQRGKIDERYAKVFEFSSQHIHDVGAGGPADPAVEPLRHEGPWPVASHAPPQYDWEGSHTLQYAWGRIGATCNILGADFDQDVGKRKLHVGVVGASDNHLSTPGNPAYTAHTRHAGSLAVVMATQNNRDGIWEGLHSRRTYGTSGPRIYVDFRVNGYFPGAGYAMYPPVTRTFTIRVGATNDLAEVSVIKFSPDAEPAESYKAILSVTDFPDGDKYENTSFTDTTPLPEGGQEVLYYLRVREVDRPVEPDGGSGDHIKGHVALTTPIWVSILDADANGVSDGMDSSNRCWPGDMNGDGMRNGDDVRKFTDVFVGIEQNEMYLCPADMNENNMIDDGDEICFSNLLVAAELSSCQAPYCASQMGNITAPGGGEGEESITFSENISTPPPEEEEPAPAAPTAEQVKWQQFADWMATQTWGDASGLSDEQQMQKMYDKLDELGLARPLSTPTPTP